MPLQPGEKKRVRFTVGHDELMLLDRNMQWTVEPGRVEEIIYVGMTTRYLVHLDRGERLVAVRQNMDALGDAQKFQGRPVRLAWTAEHTYVLDKGR